MKLFASDFDGTLYFGRARKSIYKQNIEKIKEFQKDNHFAIVTGRDLYSILKYNKSSSLKPNYCACFNGGYIIDENGNCLFDDKLKIDINKIVNEVLMPNSKAIYISGLNQNYAQYNQFTIKKFIVKMIDFKRNVNNINDLDKDDIYIISVLCGSEAEALQLTKKLKAMKLNCSVYQNVEYIDIVGRNASKQHAVEVIQDCFDYEKTYVIGDSYNDVCMIKEFDGFTVSSANDEIKKIASQVVNSVSEALEMIMRQE